MSSTLEMATEYLDLDMMPVPVPHGSKNPNRTGWQNERVTKEELPIKFRNGSNIGILLGKPSNNLIEVDLDSPEAVCLAPHFLPETEMKSGRDSSPESHYWYKATLETRQFQDPDCPDDERAMIIEIRSTGAQTLVEPSVHPCGEKYKWQGKKNPASVDGKTLELQCRKLAACALLARHLRYGQRHETSLAFSGGILRGGWSQAEAENFIRLAATASHDEEIEDRVRTVATTIKRLAAGEKAKGMPTLVEALGEKVVNALQSWLGLQSLSAFGRATLSIHSSEDWQDPESLPIGLLPVPQMHEELLPVPLRPWLVDITERMQSPIEFSAIPSVVALSSIVGDTVGVRPKRHDDWTVYPNLWGGIVGRPGVMKTPAIEETTKPVRRLAVASNEQFEQSLKEWEFEKLRLDAERKTIKDKLHKAIKEGKDYQLQSLKEDLALLVESQEPIERRYIVNDSTVEKLGELFNKNPRLLLLRDELIGFLKSLDKDGHESDRAFYLESWTGHGSFSYDRIGRGTLHVKSFTLAILGGIQPGPLTQYLRGALAGGVGDDGLMQRFQLLVFPDVSEHWRNVDRYPHTEAKNKAFETFEALANLDPASVGAIADDEKSVPCLRFDDEAQDFFNAWRAELEPELRSGRTHHPALEAHLSKYRKLMPALALLFHLTDRVSASSDQTAISLDAAEKSAAWCSFLFEHAKRIYGMAVNSTAHLAKTLAEHIQKGDLPNPFTARDVYLKHWTGLATPKDINEPLELLCDLNWLRSVQLQTGGRPKDLYFVNPKVGGENR